MWEVEYTDYFEFWWNTLTEELKIEITVSVGLIEHYGPNLQFPHSSGIIGARTEHLRELRVQHKGKPYRILYAFDPRRCAILLTGGNKTGSKRWYSKYVPLADKLYAEHLLLLTEEGILNE